MAVAHKDRIDRLNLLKKLIPKTRSSEDCPEVRGLLGKLTEQYDANASDGARIRAIQRDLDALVKDGSIEVVNPGGKPLRCRRTVDLDAGDPHYWAYAQQLMCTLIRKPPAIPS